MPPKKPIAGARGSLDPILAEKTENDRPRTCVSQTVRISKLALPPSRIAFSSSYSANESGRKLSACMRAPDVKGSAALLGTAHALPVNIACARCEYMTVARHTPLRHIDDTTQPRGVGLRSDTYSRLDV